VHEDLAAAVEGLDEREARSLRRRVRAALHAPTVRAREAAAAGDAAAYAAALADLAAVEVPRPALAPR
jgi:glutamyl-tRNA reductase